MTGESRVEEYIAHALKNKAVTSMTIDAVILNERQVKTILNTVNTHDRVFYVEKNGGDLVFKLAPKEVHNV